MKATIKGMIERERATTFRPAATRSVKTMTDHADGPRAMAIHYKVAEDRLNDQLEKTASKVHGL